MESFSRLTGRAAPLPAANVDTDIIFPARFLLITSKKGLGRYAFYEWRYGPDGQALPDFVLNRPEFEGAEILVAGDNFGCGSSREQAVWALAGFGVRAVIAQSFGEIFHSNCFKSGVLPIVLPPDAVATLSRAADSGAVFDIDLEAGRVTTSDGAEFSFTIDPGRREALLRGWDEIDIILNDELPNIERYEIGHKDQQPWLFENEGGFA
jgi:3-isopropylmalate/(R)-2-methylmalate dehydratase small subunit